MSGDAHEPLPARRRRVALPLHPFHPRLIDCLKSYDRATFGADIVAGFTVGVVALPLAMAFAIGAGAKPEAGIFTAIIAGFLISLLGGSRVQIGGPAGAFIVIVYGIIQQYGLANLFISTVMAGVLLFVMGLTRMGSLIRFVPVAIIIGFTNGIAILIALSQVKDFLGLRIEKLPADFFHSTRVIIDSLDTVQPAAVAIGLASLALIIAWPKFDSLVRAGGVLPGRVGMMTRLPGTIVALMLATAATGFLSLPVETIGSRFGGIPTGLPHFVLPALTWESARYLVAPTLTIALLGAIESLMCARIADGMIDDRHDPNQELMAQGVANFVVPFFGGIPATGTIARTTTNVRTGAKTPIADRRHRACADAARHRAGGRAARQIRPARCARRDPAIRRLEHGRVARIPAAPAVLAAIPHGDALDFPAHGHHRPHRGGRDRPRPGGDLFHLPRVEPHHDRACP